MLYLIINADDFGLSDNIDEAIKKLLQDKLITSATVMINQKNTQKTISYINKNRLKCCGLHLTLSRGYSTFDPTRKLTFDLSRKINWLRSLSKYNFSKKEITSQINIAANSWNVSHLDGHLHIQTFPLFYQTIINSMKSNKLEKIRNTFSRFNNGLINERFKQYYRNVMKNNQLIMPDALFDIQFFMRNISQILNLPDKSVIEVLCHPDINKNNDYELLTSLEYRNVTSKFEKISYNKFGKT